jgi:hypothetical protein
MGTRIERDSEWQEAATAASIAAARKVVLGDEAAVNMNTPVGRLSDLEWGWIVSSVIFAWISVHAQQATVEGLDVEQTIRMSMLDPNPWDVGMVSTILPRLADTSNIDWSKPLKDWSRETMTAFLLAALGLIREATIARDLGGGSITRKSHSSTTGAVTNEHPELPAYLNRNLTPEQREEAWRKLTPTRPPHVPPKNDHLDDPIPAL